ncbi:MAG TPA: tetratricopeptide repeat protein [Myxococcota bacterium]|nr:tetratricopeptide repeat protein [Myxococcota bacterium]
MPPSLRRALFLLAALALCAPVAAWSQPASGPEAKSWYLDRGRANMQIENYRAAIEAYQKALEIDPDDREALKTLGVAYQKQGLTDKAIEQFDRYLAKYHDDPEIAFQQADALGWSRYAYRRQDAIRYYRMGLAEREDLTRRHSLARLLAQDKSQVDQAIEQYEILLAAKPDDAKWRAEYRDLLLWEPRHLEEAVREYRRLADERPNDFEVQHQLARLISRQHPGGRESITRYADLVEKRPGDAALRLEYAQALALDKGRRDDAIEQYRLVLKQQPSRQTRIELADLLSGKSGSRDEAISIYQALLREKPGDTEVRMKLAALYAGRQDQVPLAIQEYERVVAQQPENGQAHAGLAEAYAWTGDRDQALHHGNLAAQYGATDRKLSSLREDLMRGREPRVGPLFRYLVQRGGSKAKLDGVVAGGSGQADVTPFVTLTLDGGFEDYWRKNSTAGGFVELGGEWRIDTAQELVARIGYHSLEDAAVVGKLEYGHKGESWELRGGFERVLRYDSYVALVGDKIDGESIGAARDQRFYGVASTTWGRLEARAEPYIGWVSANGAGDNFLVGARARLAYPLHESGAFDVAAFYAAEVTHYEDDDYAVKPDDPDRDPGGYFSPQVFVEQTPGLAFSFRIGETQFLDVEGGPSFQYVDDSDGTGFEFGGNARVSYTLFLGRSLYWTLEPAFTRIGDVYTRGEVRTLLTWKF